MRREFLITGSIILLLALPTNAQNRNGGGGSSGNASSGANPTATAGSVAVNGSAATFMRSDGAPAVATATTSTLGLVKTDGATLSNTSGAIAVDLTHANSWTGAQTFGAVLGTGRTVAGTTDTLAATDCGTVVEYTSGSATTVTTLASIVSGTQICSIGIYQHGAGQVTISDGASATHVSANACTKTSAQFALLSLAVYAGVGVSEYNIGGQCS